MSQTVVGSITELALHKIFIEDLIKPNSWLDYGIVKLAGGKATVTLRQRATYYVVMVTPIGTAGVANRDFVVDKSYNDKFVIISSDGADVSQAMYLAICS